MPIPGQEVELESVSPLEGFLEDPDNPFRSFFEDEEEDGKKKDKAEPKAASSPDDKPESQPAPEPTDEPAQPAAETATEPVKDDWRQQRFPDADGLHGLLRGQPIEVVDRSIRESERLMHESNAKANRLEALLAAQETKNQLLEEKLKNIESRLPQVPKPDVFQEHGVNLKRDWVLDPDRVLPVLDKRNEERFVTREELQRLTEEQAKEKEHERMQAEAYNAAQHTFKIAGDAFTEYGIPRENWQAAADFLLPTLLRSRNDGGFAESGGPLVREHWDTLLERTRIFGAQRKPAEPVAPPEIEVPETPPVVTNSRVAPSPSNTKPLTVGEEDRQRLLEIAKAMGLPEEEWDGFVRASVEHQRSDEFRQRIR